MLRDSRVSRRLCLLKQQQQQQPPPQQQQQPQQQHQHQNQHQDQDQDQQQQQQQQHQHQHQHQRQQKGQGQGQGQRQQQGGHEALTFPGIRFQDVYKRLNTSPSKAWYAGSSMFYPAATSSLMISFRSFSKDADWRPVGCGRSDSDMAANVNFLVV